MAARMSVTQRRAVLVDAALRVMKSEGVAHTSTRDIVAEAGMQIGVFHYCFESKAELVAEVMKAISARSYEVVGEALMAAQGPEAVIRDTIAAYWRHIEADPLEHLLTYELTQHALRNFRGEADPAKAQYDHYLTNMALLLEQMALVGGFTWPTPVELNARFVLAVVEGMTLQWLVDEDADAAQRTLGLLADGMVRSVRIS